MRSMTNQKLIMQIIPIPLYIPPQIFLSLATLDRVIFELNAHRMSTHMSLKSLNKASLSPN